MFWTIFTLKYLLDSRASFVDICIKGKYETELGKSNFDMTRNTFVIVPLQFTLQNSLV
jgi:hypothetical protein